MKSFRRNLKGISPIFATLILIAIAVIAGVVVYMFTSGTLATMTNGGTAGQEKLAVQGASYATPTVTVYVEQTSGPAATINGLIIKDGSGTIMASATPLTITVPAPSPAGSLALKTGVLTTVTGTYASLPSGSYTVTVTTSAGGSFISPSFTYVAP